jgi:hypothetical protein
MNPQFLKWNQDGTITYFSIPRQQIVTERDISEEELNTSFSDRNRWQASWWKRYCEWLAAQPPAEDLERIKEEHQQRLQREAELDALREENRRQIEANMAVTQQRAQEAAQREFERLQVQDNAMREMQMEQDRVKELERDVIGGGELKKS